MQTKRILLRKVELEDYDLLFRFRNTDTFRSFVHYDDSRLESVCDFFKEFKANERRRRFQYVIIQRRTGVIVGYIYTHTFSERNGHCFVNVYVDDRFKAGGYGVEAFALLFCFLVEEQSLHKVYVEVSSQNTLSVSTVHSVGFSKEGYFKNHRYIDGKPHDVIRFAGYSDLVPRFKKIIQR